MARRFFYYGFFFFVLATAASEIYHCYSGVGRFFLLADGSSRLEMDALR